VQESWNQVKQLVEELKKFLLMSGVPERQVTMPEVDPDINVIPLAKFNEIFDWLHQLKLSDEYVKVLKVWALVPEHQWAGYVLHEISGLQEQILLEVALAKLRRKWKQNRPSFFGRKFTAKGSKDETEKFIADGNQTQEGAD